MMDEKLCVPSNVIEHLKTFGDPNAATGWISSEKRPPNF